MTVDALFCSKIPPATMEGPYFAAAHLENGRITILSSDGGDHQLPRGFVDVEPPESVRTVTYVIFANESTKNDWLYKAGLLFIRCGSQYPGSTSVDSFTVFLIFTKTC